MHRLVLFAFAFALAALALPNASAAVPITVGYTGVIDFVDDPLNQLDPTIGIGTPFTGSYTIDPDALASSFEGSPGAWFHNGNFGSMTFDIASMDLSRSVDVIETSNDINTVIGVIDAWTIPFPVGGIVAFPAFTDSTLTRITDPSQFFVNTSEAGWDDNGVAIYDGSVNIVASGRFTQVFVVPEPSTLVLFGFGLVGVTARRRTAR